MKPSVLIIDDSPESIDVLCEILGDAYQVKVAIGGARGIELATSSRPELILLDVMMPDVDGYEVCRALKTDPATASIPVMFVTTLADVDSETRALDAGAVDYLTKPFVPPLVRSRVRAHVALRRHSATLEELVAVRTRELMETRLQVIQRLGRAAEYRDNETGMHVMRMSHVSRIVSLRLGRSDASAELLMQAAPMHDIGKIGIPDRILLKPGALVGEEWEVMKRHTTIGAEIIGEHPSELLQLARSIALHHHERWDGSGYPHGLRGEAIPEDARIVAVADVFDALLSERPYKQAWTVERTVAYLTEASGSHLDPAAVRALLDLLPECLAIRDRFSDGAPVSHARAG
jgi:putative two-component system response regulator